MTPNKANPWLGVVYRQIGAAVRDSAVAHADETRHFRGSEARWLWALTARGLSYFLVHYSRGKQAAAALGHTRTAHQCQHLLKDEALCWTFLNDPRIPLTNNAAERALRPYVIWRKLSFAAQSARGDRFRPMVLSVIGSAQSVGISTAKLLRRLCTEGLTQREITLRLPIDRALPEPVQAA